MKKSAQNLQKTEYVAIDDNIYQSGSVYRVRVTINGVRHSKNFTNRRNAVIYRNQLKRSTM